MSYNECLDRDRWYNELTPACRAALCPDYPRDPALLFHAPETAGAGGRQHPALAAVATGFAGQSPLATPAFHSTVALADTGSHRHCAGTHAACHLLQQSDWRRYGDHFADIGQYAGYRCAAQPL